MKYFNNKDFMIMVDEDNEKIDLMAASYNNFNNVKECFPNKILNTNREVDKLLPKHVMSAITTVKYNDVENDNKTLALIVGKYGYTQEQFEKIQELFNKGKSIKSESIKLFIADDYEKNIISYELLEKDNPLGVVLGNITNCCQIIGGAGQSCVEYGITQPNSKFITFNYNNTIIGQSWVWYDEESKTICLDNIEVPEKYYDILNKKSNLQKTFIECLYRVAKGFKEEMKLHGLQVEHVTIGEGYNDVNKILEKAFGKEKIGVKLKDYNGYSDASKQYEIKGDIH